MNIKFLLVSLAAGLSLSATAKDYSYQSVPGDPMQARIYTLDNGLKVYLSVNKEKPRVQTYIAVRTGSRNDPAETTGLAHYLEHLMFKGTQQFGTTDYAKEKPFLDDIRARYERYRKLTDAEERRVAYHEIDSVSQLAARYNIPNEYDKLMASIGAEGTNAYTSNDQTCYVEDIPSNEIDKWARIQADRFQNMVIRGFHTELEAVYEEYNIGLASDSRKEFQAFMGKLFPNHPYGTQSTIGTQEHLKNPSIVNIENYFKRYYVPNNVAIVMAGDFNPDEVIATIDRYFGAWKPAASVEWPKYAPVPTFTAPQDTTVMGLESENVMLGWKLPAANKLQADTARVVADLLMNGKAGLFDLNLTQPMRLMGAYAFAEQMADYSSIILEGMPKEGQTLEEVRSLMLAEIEKLKAGQFDESLLKAVINNLKLEKNRALLNNRQRTETMKDAFILQQNWEDVAHGIDLMATITKADIVSFAQRYLTNGYVTVFKRQGEDTSLKKIDKPAITAIPANRDLQSQFLANIVKEEVKPIEARFVDFKADLKDTKTSKGLPLLYKQNTSDELFNLSFRYDFGTEDDKQMETAADYLTYIGTQKKTLADINKAFYALACDFSVSVSNAATWVTLSGLSENMPQALQLLEELLQQPKADRESYDQYVALVLKNRADNKASQRTNFAALTDYTLYGPYNPTRNIMSESELKGMNPQMLVDKLKALRTMEHTVFYFGPMAQKQLEKVLTKHHATPKHLTAVPQGREYTAQATPAANEILLAPYDAKNIYMRQYHNAGQGFSLSGLATKQVFNQYFGGGMNGIVFQELREARGLAYNAYASYSAIPRVGHNETYFTHIISQNDKMMDCIRVFSEILDEMPQSQGAFDIAKQGLKKSIESERTTREQVLYQYYDQAVRRGLTQPLSQTIYEQLPHVTLQDIVSFERQAMAHKSYRFCILGDEKALDMDALQKIGTIRRVSTEEIFGY